MNDVMGNDSAVIGSGLDMPPDPGGDGHGEIDIGRYACATPMGSKRRLN